MRAVFLAIAAVALLGCAQPPPTTAPASARSAGKPTLMPGTPILDRQWSGDPDKFAFAILGDKTGDGVAFWPVLDRAVDDINMLNPDFTIMVGDMVQGYVRDTTELVPQVNLFRRHIDRLRVPFFMTAGNHDVYYPEQLDWWRRNYGRTYYSFDYKGCHFIVLNSEETRTGVDPGFSDAQIAWVAEDLAAHRDARHTFVFLHKPAWIDPSYADEWVRIEAALGDRQRTVFCGHTHRLSYSMRKGNEYIVLGPTGGALRPSPVKELGLFHHYTLVTVDGDSAHIALLEPGSIIRRDIAPQSFGMAARRLFRIETAMPTGLGTANVTTGFAAYLRNLLPDTATVGLRVLGAGESGWRQTSGPDTAFVVLAPGDSTRIDARFATSTDRALTIPRVRASIRYAGQPMSAMDRPLSLFPDSVLRRVPEWEAVGPYDAGPWNAVVGSDWAAAYPLLFERLGPEEPWAAGATFRDGGRTLRPVRIASEERNGEVFLHAAFDAVTPIHALAFCRFAVYSPDARKVYAALSADDMAQLTVNGALIDGGAVYRGAPPSGYVVLPLRAGWNTVLVKSMNNVSGWRFGLMFADPGNELRFAVRPE